MLYFMVITTFPHFGIRAAFIVLGLICLPTLRAEPTPEAMRSPVNQVFQFMQSGEYTTWSDGVKSKSTAYLWIPEKCQTLRGLLILGNNVPEHMLVGHPKIREVCAAHDLGIVWCAPSFLNTKTPKREENVLFLQQLLDGLAASSGYAEVATVPWIPIGESGHLIMVDALIENSPDRCICGLFLKNHHFSPKNRTVPIFVAFGSAQEWSQDQRDFGTIWNSIDTNYDGMLKMRAASPNWPMTYLIDGWSGHFDCSERLVTAVARYIASAVAARLPDKPGDPLKPIDLKTGFLADLPVPGHENKPVQPYRDAADNDRTFPWYFDEAAAKEAQAIASINWKAKSQLPAFATPKGEVFPFTFNGISWLNLNQKPEPAAKTPTPDGVQPVMFTEDDGITFTIKPVLLDKVPEAFKVKDTLLAQTPGTPTVEWLCGCLEPLGENKFRIALDRTWPSPLYLAVRQPGTDDVRSVVQPGQIPRSMNSEGVAQKITFPTVSDVKAGTASVELKATTDSGLPVKYFVVAGPATIDGNKVVFTAIPPRAKLPLAVTIGAWQWGRYSDPKIKRADIVRQTFQVVP
jgi:hypothetical protein